MGDCFSIKFNEKICFLTKAFDAELGLVNLTRNGRLETASTQIKPTLRERQGRTWVSKP